MDPLSEFHDQSADSSSQNGIDSFNGQCVLLGKWLSLS
jgi:hypothetical protein